MISLIKTLSLPVIALFWAVTIHAAVPITSLPAVLTVAGSYELDSDFTFSVPGGTAIQINGSHIRLDFKGHTITSTGAGYGVVINPASVVTINGANLINFLESIRIYSSRTWVTNCNLWIIGVNGIGIRETYASSNIVVSNCAILGNGSPGQIGIYNNGTYNRQGFTPFSNLSAYNYENVKAPSLNIAAGNNHAIANSITN